MKVNVAIDRCVRRLARHHGAIAHANFSNFRRRELCKAEPRMGNRYTPLRVADIPNASFVSHGVNIVERCYFSFPRSSRKGSTADSAKNNVTRLRSELTGHFLADMEFCTPLQGNHINVSQHQGYIEVF